MTLCQPVRSLPLNSAVKPSGGALTFSALSSAKAAMAPRPASAARARGLGIGFIRDVLLAGVDSGGPREDVLFLAPGGKEEKRKEFTPGRAFATARAARSRR